MLTINGLLLLFSVNRDPKTPKQKVNKPQQQPIKLNIQERLRNLMAIEPEGSEAFEINTKNSMEQENSFNEVYNDRTGVPKEMDIEKQELFY